MQFAQTNTRLTFRRAIKRAGICSLIVLTALGALVARTLLVDRQVNADIQSFLCKKNASGGWDIIDQAKGAVSFKASTTDALRGEINTKHVWSVRSEKGRQVSINLERAGKFRIDKATGELEFDLPFAVNLDGKRIAQSVKISSASVSTPLGQKGKKIRIEGGSAIAEELVGFVRVEGGSVGIATVEGGSVGIATVDRQPGAVIQGGSASAKGVAEKTQLATEIVLLIVINAKAR